LSSISKPANLSVEDFFCPKAVEIEKVRRRKRKRFFIKGCGLKGLI
jgi:hypothetical protein